MTLFGDYAQLLKTSCLTPFLRDYRNNSISEWPTASEPTSVEEGHTFLMKPSRPMLYDPHLRSQCHGDIDP